MATAQEHMIADFAAALVEDGTSVVIDGGDSVLVFLSPAEITPSEFERNVVERQTIYHQLGDVAQKVPGQIVSVGTVRWDVVSHKLGKISGVLILQRYTG